MLRSIPTSSALDFAAGLGLLVYALDPRGRRAGHQNLAAVFGEEMSPRERRRILVASYRNAIAAEVLLFHLQPLTREKYRRFVRVDPDYAEAVKADMAKWPSLVIAAGHLGNWELLLGSRHVIDGAPAFTYLAETTGVPSVDDLFARLRDPGAGSAALRKRGAFALKKALADGGSVALLVDRNVRGWHGGRYVPFLGLPARTTALPAMLARWYGVPLLVLLTIPEGRNRWRLWFSADCMGERTDDEEADVSSALERMNAILSRAIREHPSSWAWMLKRFKSRPTPELGPYPAYSLYDPDPPRATSAPGR